MARQQAALAVVLVTACGGVTADSPLTVSLGLPRDQAVAQLRAHQYCRAENPPQPLEIYPRCDRPGTEWGESWVSVRFEKDQLVELRRYERFSDDARAIERWNALVAARGKVNVESDEALAALEDKGLLEPGTRTVKAFRVDATTIAGVYLLTPQPPEQASILEAIVHIAKK